MPGQRSHKSAWIIMAVLAVLLIVIVVLVVRQSSKVSGVNGDAVTELGESNAPDRNTGNDAAGMIRAEAQVDTLRLDVLESFPVQVRAVVSGNLPDGCTQIADADMRRSNTDKSFDITLFAERPRDAMCTEALVPYTETLTLNTDGLSAGIYMVSVNGQSESFELEVDNTVGFESDKS